MRGGGPQAGLPKSRNCVRAAVCEAGTAVCRYRSDHTILVSKSGRPHRASPSNSSILEQHSPLSSLFYQVQNGLEPLASSRRHTVGSTHLSHATAPPHSPGKHGPPRLARVRAFRAGQLPSTHQTNGMLPSPFYEPALDREEVGDSGSGPRPAAGGSHAMWGQTAALAAAAAACAPVALRHCWSSSRLDPPADEAEPHTPPCAGMSPTMQVGGCSAADAAQLLPATACLSRQQLWWCLRSTSHACTPPPP